MTMFGVSARRNGAALVGVDRPDVRLVETFGDLRPLAARMRELAGEGGRFVVDLDQRGEALIRLLGGGPWGWYRKAGKERAELTTWIDYGLASGTFHVGREVPGANELARALGSITKSVDEDGAPESAVAVALALALGAHPGPIRIW